MILFVLIGQLPIVLLVTLVIMCYLTGFELRNEPDPFLIKAWWVLLVFLTNIVGFAAFWIWLTARRRRRRAGARPHAPPSSRTRRSRATFSASSSESRSSSRRSSFVICWIRSSRCRTVFGVDVEGAGARRDAAARGEIALERVDEVRVAFAVVVDQRAHGLAVAVARRLVELEVDEVAIGAEALVGDRATGGGERARDPRGVGRLAHAPACAGGAALGVAHADVDAELRA